MELKKKCYLVRNKLKLSQKDFAFMLHTNQTEISFIERGFIPKGKQIDIINKLYKNIFGKVEE